MVLAWPAVHPRHIVLVVGVVTPANEDAVTTLLAAGFDAIAVETGAATLALLETGFRPCIVVLDADMPDMDVWELWERLKRQSDPDPPAAVLLSTDLVDATRARAVDIREFLRKPVAHERLLDTVERHCPRRASRSVDGLLLA